MRKPDWLLVYAALMTALIAFVAFANIMAAVT